MCANPLSQLTPVTLSSPRFRSSLSSGLKRWNEVDCSPTLSLCGSANAESYGAELSEKRSTPESCRSLSTNSSGLSFFQCFTIPRSSQMVLEQAGRYEETVGALRCSGFRSWWECHRVGQAPLTSALNLQATSNSDTFPRLPSPTTSLDADHGGYKVSHGLGSYMWPTEEKTARVRCGSD